MPITTTLGKIRHHSPNEDAFKKLCDRLGGLEEFGEDTPLTFDKICEVSSPSDAIWCLRTVETDPLKSVEIMGFLFDLLKKRSPECCIHQWN